MRKLVPATIPGSTSIGTVDDDDPSVAVMRNDDDDEAHRTTDNGVDDDNIDGRTKNGRQTTIDRTSTTMNKGGNDERIWSAASFKAVLYSRVTGLNNGGVPNAREFRVAEMKTTIRFAFHEYKKSW